MPIIITITNDIIKLNNSIKVYNYYERILNNIYKNEYDVFYSGQNKGRLDYQLTDSIKNDEIFKIYYRPYKNMSYKYLGYTTEVKIEKIRKLPLNVDTTIDQRLQIHLIINNIDNKVVPINDFTGPGKFKKDVFVHSGLIDTNNNTIKEHNRNTNLGFYYFE